MTRQPSSLGRRPAALALVVSLASLWSCGGASGPAAAPPTTAPAAAPQVAASDRPPAPMYKPSSRNSTLMRLDDPAYGAYGDAPDAPGLGDTLPDFQVALADGGTFDLAQARQAGPVLVMFYRGFW